MFVCWLLLLFEPWSTNCTVQKPPSNRNLQQQWKHMSDTITITITITTDNINTNHTNMRNKKPKDIKYHTSPIVNVELQRCLQKTQGLTWKQFKNTCSTKQWILQLFLMRLQICCASCGIRTWTHSWKRTQTQFDIRDPISKKSNCQWIFKLCAALKI